MADKRKEITREVVSEFIGKRIATSDKTTAEKVEKIKKEIERRLSDERKG